MVQSINEPNTPAFNEVSGAEKPTITAIEPTECEIGGEDFQLVITGEGFAEHSVIYFAGHDEPTTFDAADGTLSTGVKPSLWAAPATVQCLVHNGTLYSAPVDFEFTEPAPEVEEEPQARGPTSRSRR